MADPLQTPVVFIIFNRPQVTERVFSAIAQVRPRQLLVIADGPRPDRPGEAERVTHIGGSNKQFGRRWTEYSYYFTRYRHIWDWATWAFPCAIPRRCSGTCAPMTSRRPTSIACPSS